MSSTVGLRNSKQLKQDVPKQDTYWSSEAGDLRHRRISGWNHPWIRIHGHSACGMSCCGQEAPAYAGTTGEVQGLSYALRCADVLLQMLQLRQESAPGSIAGNDRFLPQIASQWRSPEKRPCSQVMSELLCRRLEHVHR